MAGYSKYPNKIDGSQELPVAIDLITPVKAEVVNRLRDATISVESELGIDPSREFGTVRARLDYLTNLINGLEPSPSPPGVSGGVPTIEDKSLAPIITAGDSAYTNIDISKKPRDGSYVTVIINGMHVSVGDGSKLEDCYFSTNSSGTTAKKFKNIKKGDKLIWNGVIAGFNLDSFDVIDLDYDI